MLHHCSRPFVPHHQPEGLAVTNEHRIGLDGAQLSKDSWDIRFAMESESSRIPCMPQEPQARPFFRPMIVLIAAFASEPL